MMENRKQKCTTYAHNNYNNVVTSECVNIEVIIKI